MGQGQDSQPGHGLENVTLSVLKLAASSTASLLLHLW